MTSSSETRCGKGYYGALRMSDDQNGIQMSGTNRQARFVPEHPDWQGNKLEVRTNRGTFSEHVLQRQVSR